MSTQAEPMNVIAEAVTQDTEQRTFRFVAASRYEVWQLVTFMGWAGQDIEMTNATRSGIELTLTLRPNKLGLPEMRWLLQHFFQLASGVDSLQLSEGQAHLAAQPPCTDLLFAFAQMVHEYLDMFDVPAILKSMTDEMDRGHFDVAVRMVPSPERDPEGFKRHLRICMDCIRISYLDDSFER